MIAPIDGCRALDAGLRKIPACSFEIDAAHGKRMVAFGERMRNETAALLGRQGWASYLEQREILWSTLEQRLIPQMSNYGQPEHLGIKALGRGKLVNFDPEMV